MSSTMLKSTNADTFERSDAKTALIGNNNVFSRRMWIRVNSMWLIIVAALVASNIVLAVKLAAKDNDGNSGCPPPIPSLDKIPRESIIVPTLEMAVNHTIAPDSAAYYNRSGDVNDSPYYSVNNFYDGAGTVTSSLKILPKFKTYQQTSAYSCGPASAFMALRFLGVDNVTENGIASVASTSPFNGTFTPNLADAIRQLTDPNVIEVSSTPFTKDYEMAPEAFFDFISANIEKRIVTLVANIEWGGHWMALIGYDDMGTPEHINDDVIVLADPFDTTDQNQDGYIVRSAERFYSEWFVTMFPEGYRRFQYVTVFKKP